MRLGVRGLGAVQLCACHPPNPNQRLALLPCNAGLGSSTSAVVRLWLMSLPACLPSFLPACPQLEYAERLLRAYQTDVENSYRRDGLLPAQEKQQEAPESPMQQQQTRRRASDGDIGGATTAAVGGAVT